MCVKVGGEEGEGDGRTFAVEEFGAVFAGERDGFGDLAHELDDLRDVVVVFAVPRPRGGVEEVIAACDKFEDLWRGVSRGVEGEGVRSGRGDSRHKLRSIYPRSYPTWRQV